jgi:hypothetical protein
MKRALSCILRLFDDRADVFLGLLGEQVERAPPRLVARDLGAGEPGAVHVAIQVVLGADVGAELVKGEANRKNVSHAPSL